MTESQSKMTVLVVDDSPFSRKLVEHALRGDSCTLVFAENGNEALRLFKEHRPAVVITDWMLPDLSGPELCGQMRRESTDFCSYIILLTSMTEKEDIVKGLSSGADDYLTKPFDRGELLARIGVGRRTVALHAEIESKNKLLDEMAHSDPLTGLPNRRAIEEWSQRQLRGAVRHGYPLWVAHLDLDCFKGVNDSCGHQAGDEVLKSVAAVLKENTRASDICGRTGGDEFLYVVSHVPEEHICTTVDRLRKQIAAQKFSFGGKNISVTASIGVCGFQGEGTPEFAKLVHQADMALYAAKRAGRNQIKIDPLGTRQGAPLQRR